MKSNNVLIGSFHPVFVLRWPSRLVFWVYVSLVAKIGFFVLGFGSGVTAGQWLAIRSAQEPPRSHRLVTEAVGRLLAAQQLAEADPAGSGIGRQAWPTDMRDN